MLDKSAHRINPRDSGVAEREKKSPVFNTGSAIL